MSINNQDFINFQGDVSLASRVSNIGKSQIDIEVGLYSGKWDAIDIRCLYRHDNSSPWKNDTKIHCDTAINIQGNRLYGLESNRNGVEHAIRWNYLENVKGFSNPQIKFEIIPKTLCISDNTYIWISGNWRSVIAKSSGNITFSEPDTHINVIGIDNNGNYIYHDLAIIFLGDFMFSGVILPLHAMQNHNRRYIVCDTGNDRVLEIDSGILLSQISVNDPVFSDYDNANNRVLITSRSDNKIYEYSFSSPFEILWESDISLNSPSSATYSKYNGNILIANTDDNNIVLYNRTEDTYKIIDHIENKLGGNTMPIRNCLIACQIYPSQIIFAEKSGQSIEYSS